MACYDEASTMYDSLNLVQSMLLWMMKPFFYTLSNAGVTLQHQLKVLLTGEVGFAVKKVLISGVD